MVKFLKRTLYVILAFIALSATSLYMYSNSDKFAKDIVYLECILDGVGSDTREKGSLDALRNTKKGILIGKLRKDWIKDKVLLNWVADEGTTEHGLEGTQKLGVGIRTYSGYITSSLVSRSFDRNTLVYTWKRMLRDRGNIFDEFDLEEVDYWITRKCVIVDESVFETERKKSAAATKAKQKI